MPNHLHWIFTLPEQMNDVIKIIQTFKSFTAVQILKELKRSILYNNEHVAKIFDGNKNIIKENASALLNAFHRPNPAKRSFHRFWQTDSDLKAVYSESFLREKLDYIHYNPVQEHWLITEEPEDYPFSSYRYYYKDDDWNGIDILSLL